MSKLYTKSRHTSTSLRQAAMIKKSVYRLLVFFFVLSVMPSKVFASHIVGGALTYTYNGGNNYTVMLKLYRDCSGVAFPASVNIGVYQADGSLFTVDRSFTMNGGTIINIPATLPPCATTPSVVPCVQERTYTLSVNLAPSPGGMHMVYSVCCRNPSILNITTPSTVGETFYAFIPCYLSQWAEDFTLANGTTTDAGPTAWTRTLGATPPTSAQVNNGQFEIIGSNNGSMIWASQIINISAFGSGVNLSANISKAGANWSNNDTLKLFYSINSGPKALWPVNGLNTNNWGSPRFSTATGLIGNTIQLYLHAHFNNNNNSTGKTFDADMITVYDNTFIPNSSPAYTNLPPLFVCSTNTFALNHSATDADGDVLVYSMYTPYNDAPAPTFPNNVASIPSVTWTASYSANSPFNSPSPSVTLSPTGILSGVANTNGQFVFGVKCQEYRGGVLLSEMVRDYQMNTVTCPPFVPSAPVASANTPLCVGQTLNLAASFTAGATYSWTGPGGFTSTSINPSITNVTALNAGTYSVTATVSGCTSPPGTVAVVVNPTPAAPTAGSNSPLCAGQTLNLTATPVAGATYSWVGPNSFSSALQNPSIAGITVAGAGTYSVTATVTGCTSAPGTAAVVVNPAPAAPTAGSNAPLCAGQTLNLTASPIGGASYSWTGPNSFSSALQNPSIAGVTVAGAGTYSVTANVAGCTGPAGTVAVVVNPAPAAPTAGSNSPLCEFQNLNLTASTIAGATYNWAGPNSFSSSSQNPSIPGITVAGAGVYSVTATVAGCPGPAGTVNVVVNPSPAAPTAGSNSPLCAGQTLNLTASAIGGATYSWTGPNSFSSALQNPSIVGTTTAATGMYSVTATVAGCTGPAGTVSVNVFGVPSPPTLGSNSPVCAASTLSLTASTIAGATYNWTGPNSFSSVLQNPTISNVSALEAGTYSVLVTVGGCGSAVSTISVTVLPTPAAPTAGSNSPLCAGQTLNLTASAIAGATYSWIGPNSFTSTAQNPSIPATTTLAAGTYSVNATVTGCTGLYGTVNVVINPTPAPPTAASNAPLCVGNTLNLTASNIAGATYNWTGPSAFSSALQNPSIVGVTSLNAGTYSVTATVAGCTSVPGTVGVVINPTPPAPTAGSNSPLCEFQTLNLTASTIAGATYSWTGPNSFSSSTQNPSIPGVTVAGAGTYSVTVTVGGCTGAAGTVNVVINPSPAAPTLGSNSPICAGQTLNLTASPIAGATYSWTGPNSFSSALQNPSIAGASTLATGMYSLTATLAGCPSPVATVSVNVFGVPGPPTLGSNSPVCAASTLSLTASTIAGATYNWTGPNSFSSTLQNPTVSNVSALDAGTYSVLVTVGGCGSATSTINITVLPTPAAPTAGSNAPLCQGQTLNLTASNIAGATYNWIGPNSFTSTTQNPSIAGTTTLATGTYSVSATVGGCTGLFGTVNVVINPTPATPTATSNAPLCIGATINFTASTIAGATYNWSGPSAFSSTLQNPSIAGASASNAGTYSVTATVAGCVGSAGTVAVVVSPIPPAPTAGNNSPICEFQILSLTSSTVAGATYSWTGPSTFTSTTQNPSIASASLANAGTYSVVAIVGGCASAPATTSVTINPSPASPTAGSNSPLCLGSTINLTASTIAGATYSWTGPNTFTSTNQNPSLPGTTTLTSGTYSVVAIVTGCPSIPGTVSVSVTAPATVVAGPSQTVCGNNAATVLNGSSTTGTGVWSGGSGTFSTSTAILNATYTPSAAEISAGSTTLILTSTNNGACAAASSTMVITITPAPTSNAGPNQSVCANNATVALNGSVTIATGGIWSSSGTGTFTPSNTNLNATYIFSPADITAGSVTLSLTTTGNGNCIPVVSTMVVTLFPAPVVSAGPNIQFVCKNNPNPTLNATSTTGSGVWQTLGTGAFTPTNNILSPTYLSSTADTTAGSVFIIFTSTNNGTCLAVKDTIKLVYTSTITIGAGASQTVCANNSTIALTATCTTGAGSWTTSGSGIFSPNTLTGNYIPSLADISAGSVTLTVTSGNNGTCLPITATVVMFFTPAPTANAGPDKTVCANNSTVTLNGSFTAPASGGVWTTSGTGTFSPNNTNMNANYIPSSADTTAGSVTIYLSTTGNGNCLAVKDSMTIFFTPAPLVNAGPDIFVCKTNPNAGLNATCSTGTGTWTTLGSGTFNPNNTVLNPLYIPSTADTTAGTVTLIFTSGNNGSCNAVKDTVKIIYSAPPTLTAAISQSVACSNFPVALTGLSSTGSATWTTSGTGLFAPNTMTGNYIPSASDGTLGIVTLTMTSTNNGGCTPVSAAITLSVIPGPTANAGPNITICANAPSVPLSGTITIATGAVWSSSGTGTFSPNNTNLNTNYIPSGADTTAGSVMIFFTTAGNGSCNPKSDTLVINFMSAPQLSAGADIFVCKNNPNATLNGSTSAPSYTWSALGSGSFNPNTNILNPTYIPSSADTTAGSVTLVLTANGSSVCAVVRDTVKIFYQGIPKANFAFANKCVNSITTFTDLSTVATGSIVSWMWNFGGVSTSTVQNPTSTFTATGSQTVSLVVSTGCLDSIKKVLFVNSLPTASFTAMSLCHDSAQFSGIATISPGNISTWNWNFGDTTSSLLQNPVHVYKDTGNYIVTLTVMSDSGCVGSYLDTLYIKKCNNDFIISNPAVPGAFTPNGDGYNDILFVKGGPFNNVDFRVFNEWGNQIFRSTDASVGWDGKVKGATSQAGRYIWTLNCEVIDGRTVKLAGEVILTR